MKTKMERIKCKSCGNIGYTASPKQMRCECGSKFKIIPETSQKEETKLDAETTRLLDTLN